MTRWFVAAMLAMSAVIATTTGASAGPVDEATDTANDTGNAVLDILLDQVNWHNPTMQCDADLTLGEDAPWTGECHEGPPDHTPTHVCFVYSVPPLIHLQDCIPIY